MKGCLIVLGGDIQDTALFQRRLSEAELVLAADSGARHLLRLGFMPGQIFGDLDSLTADEIRACKDGGCQFVTSPAEKNDTDGVIVLREALNRGYKDIRIWGALGGRPDHSYANIVLLQLVYLPAFYDVFGSGEEALPAITIEDGGMRIFIPKKKQWIEGEIGDYLSFFALTQEVTGFTQVGLKYQPAGGRFISGFPLGISNEFMQGKACIDWEDGILLCMHIQSK